MFRKIMISSAICALVLSGGSPAPAALTAVSGVPDPAVNEVLPGGNPAQVAISLANGFPVWYRDVNGLKLELCLDPPSAVTPGSTILVDPCMLALPFTGAPPSFPGNFGPEALYWTATILGNYTSSNGVNNAALLVLTHQAGFAIGGLLAPTADGNQAVFSRIRMRIALPVAGTYRVTHPFGSRDYVVTTPGTRSINQTQDRGLDLTNGFLTSMPDGPPPVAPVDPSLSTGAVNANGATIGPFLVPSQVHGGVFNPADPATFTGGPVTFNGARYIGLPLAPNLANPNLPLSTFQPIAPVGGVNYFEIQLLTPPPGFLLDANGIDGTADNTVRFTGFQLLGKIFDNGPNLAPTAVADVAGVAPGIPVNIDVVANDTDPPGPGNVHGINPQAIALVHPGTGALVRVQGPDGQFGISSAAGGHVRRVTAIPTGKTTFRYTPPAGFTGIDTFSYVVQDRGGLISPPATVTVTVEDLRLDRAHFKPRLKKWSITGTTTNRTANAVTLTTGPLAALNGAGEVPAVVTNARAQVGLRVTADAIDFALKVDPLPASAVTAVRIHVGAPGENGPIIFSLFNSQASGTFTGSTSGTLREGGLLIRPEKGINTFADAVNAILSGSTYVNVLTAAKAGGEIRGQLLRPLIGTATVEPTGGAWLFEGKGKVSPGILPTVNAESSNGVLTPGAPLKLR